MVFPNALLAFPTKGLAGIALPTVCGAMQQLFNRNLGTGPYRGAKIVGVGMANKCKRYRFDSSIMKDKADTIFVATNLPATPELADSIGQVSKRWLPFPPSQRTQPWEAKLWAPLIRRR